MNRRICWLAPRHDEYLRGLKTSWTALTAKNRADDPGFDRVVAHRKNLWRLRCEAQGNHGCPSCART